MFDCLGYDLITRPCVGWPRFVNFWSSTASAATPTLLVPGLGHGACVPCTDGGRRLHLEATVRPALDWLEAKQVLEVVGDWAAARPACGQAVGFQFENPYYPDLDERRRSLSPSTASAARVPVGDRACGRMGCRDAEPEGGGDPSTPTTRIFI